MQAQRPRPSLLSLFDPLSSSERSLSPDSDKENHGGETSFLHPFGVPKQVMSPVHKLRRRLIDIGDMTIEEQDIRDLVAEEEELGAEINQSVAGEDDENATLTFRDMAKAATPKWSGRHAATIATPKSSQTPRTPLGEIVLKDEITPMGRKKTFKRPIPLAQSNLAPQVGIPQSSQDSSPLILGELVNVSGNSSLLGTAAPSIEISYDTTRTTNSSASPDSGVLGSSVATLELSTPSGTLISDTPIPVFISPSSPESSSESCPITPPPVTESRLRPNAHLINTNRADRFSVDLQHSFQLQMNASENTFDLLNDKISFFGASGGMGSFLEEGPSFGDEEEPSVPSHKAVQDHPIAEPAVSSGNAAAARGDNISSNSTRESRGEVTLDGHIIESVKSETVGDEVVGQVSSLPSSGSPVLLVREPAAKDRRQSLRRPSIIAERTVLSTPSSSQPAVFHPPCPVPALKIVKRSKAVDRVKTSSKGISASRRTSSIMSVHAPISRAAVRSSPENVPPITTISSIESVQPVRVTSRVAHVPTATRSGDGPKRVLVSEGPRLQLNSRNQEDSGQPKAPTTMGGPRRIPPTVPEKVPSSARPAGSALKQPVKYATVGPASTIPKPVNRNSGSGSRIPAPSATNSTSKQRFGVPLQSAAPGQTKGLLNRRVL